jgi:hypothetical protein
MSLMQVLLEKTLSHSKVALAYPTRGFEALRITLCANQRK